MQLYKINQEMAEIYDKIDLDFETGEIGENYDDELFQRFMELKMERDERLQWIAKLYLNTKAEIPGIKEEIDRLTKKKAAAERKCESLLKILDRECAGEKTDLGVATVSYRNTTKVDFTEEGLCLAWLKDNGYTDAYKVEEKISKTELKKIFKKVGDIPGAVQIQSKSCSLK